MFVLLNGVKEGDRLFAAVDTRLDGGKGGLRKAVNCGDVPKGDW